MDQQSPFAKYRDMVLGHYSTANWLRAFVMALWGGTEYKVGLSQLGTIDNPTFEAVMEMVASYREMGENDPTFMALAMEIITRMDEERAAEEREKRFEEWLRKFRYELMRVGETSGRAEMIADDNYSWLEAQFARGSSVEDAARNIGLRTLPPND